VVQAYRARKFDEAIAHYNRAFELNDEDISFLTNRCSTTVHRACVCVCVRVSAYLCACVQHANHKGFVELLQKVPSLALLVGAMA